MADSPALFFELFDGLPRQAPGDEASTRRALALVEGLTAHARILDLGCGTGTQTLVVARHTTGAVLAVDLHAPYVETLRARARDAGLATRIEARVADMGALDPAWAPFDLIWCEGAIYNVGVVAGLRAWRRWLAPGGYVAFSEACWMRPDPPADCAAFWASEYPAMRPVDAVVAAIARCGYDVIGHFAVPPSSWHDEYYAPLGRRLAPFRAAHAGHDEAAAIVAQVAREIDVWRRFASGDSADVTAGGPYYGYEFFVARVTRDR